MVENSISAEFLIAKLGDENPSSERSSTSPMKAELWSLGKNEASDIKILKTFIEWTWGKSRHMRLSPSTAVCEISNSLWIDLLTHDRGA